MADKNSNKKKPDKVISDLLKKLRPEQQCRACELIAHLLEYIEKQPGDYRKLMKAILDYDEASSGSNSRSPQPGPSTGRAPLHLNPGPTVYANSSDDDEDREDMDQLEQVEKKYDPNQPNQPTKSKKSRVEEAKRQECKPVLDNNEDRYSRDVKPAYPLSYSSSSSSSSSSSDNDGEDYDHYPPRSRSLKPTYHAPTPKRTTKLVPIRVLASQPVQKRLFRKNNRHVKHAIKEKAPILPIPPPLSISTIKKRNYQPGKNLTKKPPKAKKPKVEPKFTCEICSKTFCSKFNKARHEEEQHQGPKVFKCTCCGQLFTLKRNLMDHYRATHVKNPTPYDCPVCSKRYYLQKSLHKHIITHHHRQSDSDTVSE